VLVHATFDYPELSFTCTDDDLSTTAAVIADEHVSGHHPPEHRPG
jgi:hypothetical protein